MVKDKDLHPIYPGEILREELLKTYQITPQQLTRSIKVEENIVKQIVKEKRDITPELSFGLYWGVREVLLTRFTKALRIRTLERATRIKENCEANSADKCGKREQRFNFA